MVVTMLEAYHRAFSKLMGMLRYASLQRGHHTRVVNPGRINCGDHMPDDAGQPARPVLRIPPAKFLVHSLFDVRSLRIMSFSCICSPWQQRICVFALCVPRHVRGRRCCS
jgi:hypothetical protein